MVKISKRFKDKNIRKPIRGFKDAFGQEVRVKSFIANKISEVFQGWGYEQIVFPLVEKASSFSEQVVGSSPWPEWDKKGVFYLHVQNYGNSYKDIPEEVPALLIPEGTISVSRWLAKTLAQQKSTKDLFPLKVFYITSCFRNELISKLSSVKGREFNQVGVEILGTSNLLADIEVLFLIYEGFRAISIPRDSILVRIGSVNLFNLLCSESKVDDHTKLALKDSLDMIAESRAGKQPERLKPEINKVMEIVKKLKLKDNLIKKWKIVCNTHTHKLSEKTKTFLGYEKPVEELNKIASVLQKRGIGCVIDPSVVRSHEYYTKVVYEIDLRLANKTFVEVAGGGRYNKLITKFLAGRKYQIPAVGFAYGLERITKFFNLINKSKKSKFDVSYWVGKSNTDIVLYSKPKTDQQIVDIFSSSEKLREDDKRVSIYVGDGGKERVLEYSKKLGAKTVFK